MLFNYHAKIIKHSVPTNNTREIKKHKLCLDISRLELNGLHICGVTVGKFLQISLFDAETGFNYPQNTEVSLTSCFYICCKPDDISGSRWGLLYNKWTQYGQTLPPPNIEL